MSTRRRSRAAELWRLKAASALPTLAKQTERLLNQAGVDLAEERRRASGGFISCAAAAAAPASAVISGPRRPSPALRGRVRRGSGESQTARDAPDLP